MMARGRPWLLLGWVALTIALFTGLSTPASAAADDQIDDLAVTYTVRADGTLLVRERITLRFGTSSSRHGLERWLITREPYDGTHDAIYQITDPVVTSPGQASTAVAVQRDLGDGRVQSMRVRVGDPNRTIREPTATYELSYTVRGALRTFSGYDELYWDVTGTQFPRVLAASVRVEVPGGVVEVYCSAGPVGSSTPCSTSSVSDGVGTYGTALLAAGDPLTIAAKIGAGRVADSRPILVESADLSKQRVATTMLTASGIVALLVPLLGWWYFRRNGHDRRFAGLPPGVVPGPDEKVPEVRDTGVEIPVAFAPPTIPLVDAALLLDGQPHVRQTTATLVGLAVDGAIRLRGGNDAEARLVDSRRARDKPSAVLLEELFGGGETVADLSSGLLAEGHDRLTAMAAQQAGDQNWFVRWPARRGTGTTVIAALAAGYVAFIVIGQTALYLLPLLLSVLITLIVLNRKLSHGQRTGTGRALTDQVQGFRTYLATAEADQLRFEEGEDIFSRYLPWAVVFDLTDRWTKVCGELVAQGRLASTAPPWYFGPSWNLDGFSGQVSSLNSGVAAAASAPDFSGGTGFGGGSAFGGSSGAGGSSGGGGGGGGAGSW